MELLGRKRNRLFILVIVVVFLFTAAQILNVISVNEGRRVSESRLLRNVIVHLDLKGSPPRIPYLISLMPVLKSFGVTGFLVEYEDTFPYTGDLEVLNGNKYYSSDELAHFLSTARDQGLVVIPLIQTFGHMQFVLKHDAFADLSESEAAIDSICPSKDDSLALIENMLTQVIHFHNRIAPLRYLHVGCDEVYNMNKCDDCRNRSLSDLSLFQNHVVEVTKMVQRVSPETTILIWDDMMRDKTPGDIFIKDLPIEPVSWHYDAKLKWLMHRDLHNYHKQFKNIWIASAFKGADGPKQIIPVLEHRYRNHFSWVKKLLEYEYPLRSGMSLDTFHGIILTGWSRYSHDQPLCELFPLAYPSLILNLITLNTFKNENKRHLFYDYKWPAFFEEHARRDFLNHLKCVSPDMKLHNFDAEKCSFEGSKLYANLEYHIFLTQMITVLQSNVDVYLFNQTYIGVENVEISEILDLLERKNNYLKSQLSTNTIHVKQNSSKYYSEYVVNEYISSITSSYFQRLSDMHKKVAYDPVQQNPRHSLDAPIIKDD